MNTTHATLQAVGDMLLSDTDEVVVSWFSSQNIISTLNSWHRLPDCVIGLQNQHNPCFTHPAWGAICITACIP